MIVWPGHGIAVVGAHVEGHQHLLPPNDDAGEDHIHARARARPKRPSMEVERNGGVRRIPRRSCGGRVDVAMVSTTAVSVARTSCGCTKFDATKKTMNRITRMISSVTHRGVRHFGGAGGAATAGDA
jgi:hypothetical protein